MEPSRAVRKMAEDLISAIMEEQNASHSTTRQTLDPEEPLGEYSFTITPDILL